MSGIDQFLAEFYGTTKTAASAPPEQDLEKAAQVELFCKVASDQNIDLTSMPDEDVGLLYGTFLSKLADGKEGDESEEAEETTGAGAKGKRKSEEEPPGAPSDKHAQAAREFEEKRAMARELAQSDFLGRNAAHAYVDELKKIAAEQSAHGAMSEAIHAIKSAEAEAGQGAGPGSAFEQLAIERAIVKVAEAGLDTNVAAERIHALLTLDAIGESTKVAHASDVDMAIDIRALEILETAGYPVQWAV